VKVGFFVQGKSRLNEAPHYRGVYCERPFCCPSQSEGDRINLLSKQHWEEVEANFGLIMDLEKARELISLYRKIGVFSFCLIEVLKGDDVEDQAGFLGYDVSNDVFNDSMLTPLCMKGWERPGDGPWSRNALYRLLGEHFFPELNRFGLFKTFEKALFYLKCNEELEKTHHLCQGDVFSVIGLVEQPHID